jgi:hypothetical protein
VLYAWRECKHFYEKAAEPPVLTAAELMKLEEDREADAMDAKKRGGDEFTDVQDWSDLYIDNDFVDDF